MTPFEIRWQAPEFEYRLKGISWYWLSIIIAVFALAVAVWQKNFLFGFFIVIAEILILVWGDRKPLTLDFALTEKGLTIANKKFYALGEVDGWSVGEGEGGGWLRLKLRLRRRFAGAVAVLAPEGTAAEVGIRLAAAGIPQVEHDDSFLDALEKFFGF